MTRLNSQRENSWCVNNSWVNTICYCHHWGFQRDGTIPGPGLELSSCQLSVFQQPGKTGLEREGVWKGLGEQEIAKGKERNRDSESDTESEREEGRLIYMPTRVSVHTHTQWCQGATSESWWLMEFLPDFHNLLYSFLPSARISAFITFYQLWLWFLWFHICSSTDIQDVQFVLLNSLGPRGEVMLKNQYKIPKGQHKKVTWHHHEGQEKNFVKDIPCCGGWWNPIRKAHICMKRFVNRKTGNWLLLLLRAWVTTWVCILSSLHFYYGVCACMLSCSCHV